MALFEETRYLRKTLDAQSKRLIEELGKLPLPSGSAESLSRIQFPIDPSSAHSLATAVYDAVATTADTKLVRDAVLATIGRLDMEFRILSSTVMASAAESIVHANCLPQKLNPIVKALLKSVEKQPNLVLQTRAAAAIAKLIFLCSSRSSSPNTKLIRKLMTTYVARFNEVNCESRRIHRRLSDARALERRGAEAALAEVLRLFAATTFEVRVPSVMVIPYSWI